MQTLRKKTSPLKYKNETTRFLGDGVSFKAKLIGILEVSEARGDRMCQEALSDLKMAIRAAGEHKQRITINVAIDGLRLRDEKTGDSLYHHPVHKISFIAQDMTDSRAFGYIFGSPDTGHRFFGIKTEKAASQVVIAMRDLFQVVFALKKKEIELAKQHLDKNRYSNSPLFSDTSISSSVKNITPETSKSTIQDINKIGACSDTNKPSSGTAVADLVDLELELNSLQQGLNQMERITPSDPFGSKDDPFGDSFTSYTKPILPPPPSSGRERSSRTSDSSTSVFSPKTGSVDTSSVDQNLFSAKTRTEFSFSHDFNSSREEASSGDWFSPPPTQPPLPNNSIFEEPTLVPEPTKDEKHELAKQEILSQFDVFTELDPLGTGRSKPYIDKKHFFQELKNPPKKVLNDLVPKTQQQIPPPSTITTTTTIQDPNLFVTNFSTATTTTTTIQSKSNDFTTDPFGEDPFVMEDPFAETDFTKQDPFETEFNNDSSYNKQIKLQSLLSKSPKSSSMLNKNVQFSSSSSSTKTFDANFVDDKKLGKLMNLHENPSLDISSESECAPEPPPRPPSTLMQIKPPPLPPKKQLNDLSIKPPPPIPPHTDDSLSSSHYDYMDNYETAPNSLEFMNESLEKSPPLPVPARKVNKYSANELTAPERPKKQFNLYQSSDGEDYLTPISFPNEPSRLLPPPQSSKRHQQQQQPATTVLDNNKSSPVSFEGLDITLSQLTLSGLNELAKKLNIPANQLNNMTLVQLTNYLSNFIKSKSTTSPIPATATTIPASIDFKADFAANFNNITTPATICDTTVTTTTTYDRYAVFRELIKEEIKQTKIDTEPEELLEEKVKEINEANLKLSTVTTTLATSTIVTATIPTTTIVTTDKYAALREIVDNELKLNGDEDDNNKNEDEKNHHQDDEEEETEEDENNLNTETNLEETNHKLIINNNENEKIKLSPKFIEYIDNEKIISDDLKISPPLAPPPIKSPIITTNKTPPIPMQVQEIIQTNIRGSSGGLTSGGGSLSDVVSGGSSPEIDNNSSEKKLQIQDDLTGESWAIFDQSNIESTNNSNNKHNIVQSEEGVSPWSSDSKEFGNGSPTGDWQQRGSVGGGGESGGSSDHWIRKSHHRHRGDGHSHQHHHHQQHHQDQGWWDTSAEPETNYYPSANRRSTDSYDDDYYECYERPRRRRQTSSYMHGGGGGSGGVGVERGQGTGGGHSSSSRDVSPWEEDEPRRRQGWARHPTRQFDKHSRERRHTDSWDEEDDYESYEDEHIGRFHRNERHSSRESDRDRGSGRDWNEDWTDDRRHNRRRNVDRDRWCCPDWDQTEHDKSITRYGPGRYTTVDPPIPGGIPSDRTRDGGMRRERKYSDRYYSRDSQESPWEDDYSNDADEIPPSTHYLTIAPKRTANWKRPSSASEMDRKISGVGGGGGDVKSRHYLGTGGSDGERDRRYKPGGRRSRSRDSSQYSEPISSHSTSNRHSKDHQSSVIRNNSNRIKSKGQFIDNNEFVIGETKSKLDSNKKVVTTPTTTTTSSSLVSRKKTSNKEVVVSPKAPEEIIISNNTFPRKAVSRAKSLFENDFVSSEDVISSSGRTSDTTTKPIGLMKNFQKKIDKSQSNLKDSTTKRLYQTNIKQKSMFEDDFSPPPPPSAPSIVDKVETIEDNSISSIKEESDLHEEDEEEDDSFISTNNFNKNQSINKKKKRLNKLSNNHHHNHLIKKSESVNIFARENDPFDDDFFNDGTNNMGSIREHFEQTKDIHTTTELKWTDDFDDFDIDDKK